MALQELSMSVGRLEPRHPLRHTEAVRIRAKLILVRMYVIVICFIGIYSFPS